MEGRSQANAPSPENATGATHRVAPGRLNADRHKDNARPDRFTEPLNDTTDRTKRVYRKTPPLPINRHQSTTDARSSTPHQDDIRGSSARLNMNTRLNRFDEPLNDTTARPKRVFRKTPPPSKNQAYAARLREEEATATGSP
ncbi:hypothetical protein T484DRAFT_2020184 [Baffinella frigidus]|nr:hypothetical protein T484DRAFT_2020184 [Cryptophyta sp. CCMP2293]